MTLHDINAKLVHSFVVFTYELFNTIGSPYDNLRLVRVALLRVCFLVLMVCVCVCMSDAQRFIMYIQSGPRLMGEGGESSERWRRRKKNMTENLIGLGLGQRQQQQNPYEGRGVRGACSCAGALVRVMCVCVLCALHSAYRFSNMASPCCAH